MVLSDMRLALIAALQDGLAFTTRPYDQLATQLNCTPEEVITEIHSMQQANLIRRFGVIVRHHELGYRANAMVVWDIPDKVVDTVGEQLGAVECVTLCYRRPRRLPLWPYNLFSMIHGQNRHHVIAQVNDICHDLGLGTYRHELLFSTKRYKQRGAHYASLPASEACYEC